MMFTRNGVKYLVAVTTLVAAASCTSSEPKSDLKIDVNSNEIRVAVSEEVARGLMEELIGADLECKGELDGGFEKLLQTLDRDGPRSRAAYRDGDTTVAARRHGGKLDLDITGHGPGRIEATMPWAVAECLLGTATTIDETTTSAVKVKVVNPDSRNFSFKLE